ncbi:hypothetical protein [Actinomadura harenae]|uniref:Uncharacterized protein n=1 Tax=Actinomadura harenae TaxID=2483351 RepID=A0A3M2LNX2_9ACTN|nr:hypothetical protein [Actinomadura harenae]RMI39052.1 hypothetical protein EBO15_30785 [Actinomadura harenae]
MNRIRIAAHGRIAYWGTRILPALILAPLLIGASLWGLTSTGDHGARGRFSPAPETAAHPRPSPCDLNGCGITAPTITPAYARTHLLTFAEMRETADIRYELKASDTNPRPPKNNDVLPSCDWSRKPLASNAKPGHVTYNRVFQSWWWQYPEWADTPKNKPPRYRAVETVITYTDPVQQETDWAGFAAITCKRPAHTTTTVRDGWRMYRRSQSIHCLNIHWRTGYCALIDDYFMRGNVILALEWDEAPDRHHHAQQTADRLATRILGKFNQEMP